jgi:hypothetical protein
MLARLLPALFLTMTLPAAVKIEKTAFSGWPNCYRVSNGTIELIVTSDIGPRIMSFGFSGGQNFFWVQKEGAGKSGEPAWVLRGGHRVWVAPEDLKYTYPPDNGPVKVEIRGNVLIATQPVEKETGVEKQIEIRMAETGSSVTVIHRLRNAGIMPLEYAPWALTMMTPGGAGVTGFPPRGTHDEILVPTNPLVMWAYSNLADPRWKYSNRYLVLKQDPANTTPQKLGLFNPKTWGAYLLKGEMFLKESTADPSKTYPDMGCSYETYTINDFLEMETLGPIQKVPAGATVEHTERWSLHKNVSAPNLTEAELDKILLPVLGR